MIVEAFFERKCLMKNEVRQMTIGAIVAALIALIFLVDRMTGSMIAMYYLLIIPVILILYHSFASYRYLLMTGVTSWLLIYLVTGSIPIMVSALGYIIIAWAWCACDEKGLKGWPRYLLMTGIIAAIYAVQVLFFSTVFFASDSSYDAMALEFINALYNTITGWFGVAPILFGTAATNVVLVGMYVLSAFLEVFVITMFTHVLQIRLAKVITKYAPRT